jgi:hypothetical protein
MVSVIDKPSCHPDAASGVEEDFTFPVNATGNLALQSNFCRKQQKPSFALTQAVPGISVAGFPFNESPESRKVNKFDSSPKKDNPS